MKNLNKLIIVLFVFLILVSCTTTKYNDSELDSLKSRIHFKRSRMIVGSAFSYDIYLNREKVGNLKTGKYFSLDVDPGETFIVGVDRRFDSDTYIHKMYNTKAGHEYEFYIDGTTATFREKH